MLTGRKASLCAMVVDAWLARAAAARGSRAALICHGEEWDYARLYGAARAGAAELAARGVGSRAHVAIALPGGADFAVALHACLLLGAVAVPLDLRLSDPERERATASCALLVDRPLSGRATGVAPGATPGVERAAGAGDVPPGATGVAPGATGRVVCVGAPAPPRESHDLDAPAVRIYTSGSTATPKPVELTYGNLLWSALGSAVAIGLDSRERWLCAMPLSHIGGLSILVRSAIYGTCAVVHERFDAERVLHALRAEEITTVSLVATTLARLLDAGLEHPSALRCALTGGGPVPRALLQRALGVGVPVCLTYGLSEACSQVSTTPVAGVAGQLRDRLTAGPPLFCTRVAIAADGEILVAGPTVARGAVGEDGWLHTGDVGELEHALAGLQRERVDQPVRDGRGEAAHAVLLAHPAGCGGFPGVEAGLAVCLRVEAHVGTDCAASSRRSSLPDAVRGSGSELRSSCLGTL